jgi:type I restriction enzyme R subunit
MQPTESSSNFDFLAQDHPLLERLGRLAERYFCDDPNTCLIKLRQLGEALTQEIAARMGMLSPVKEDQFT